MEMRNSENLYEGNLYLSIHKHSLWRLDAYNECDEASLSWESFDFPPRKTHWYCQMHESTGYVQKR